MKDQTLTGPSPARRRAAEALGAAAARYPDLPPLPFDTEGLTPRDARLAQAIRRVSLQRWITLEYLLDRWLRRPGATLEPALRGILLGGAASLLFLDRQPAHAVVNESVTLARKIVRPGAGGIVNAVLRRVAQAVAGRDRSKPWCPGMDRLPLEGGVCQLAKPLLPDPKTAWEEHVAVATSHPPKLVGAWQRRFGRDAAISLCLHGLKTPPVILAFARDGLRESGEHLLKHRSPGHAVWSGPPGALTGFLAARSPLHVQDPTAAHPLAHDDGAGAETVLDFCAGLGTKTHQLVCRHPTARVIAHEVDANRIAVLRRRFADRSQVQIASTLGEVRLQLPTGADLLVLDVPCSNTGVLARRPEARYRYHGRSLQSLIQLQRRIVHSAVPFLGTGGRLLYATCSLEEEENESQARWIASEFGLVVKREHTTLPRGSIEDYQDGGYYAWLEAGRPLPQQEKGKLA